MLDQATIDRIIGAAGIADVVSEFVNLRRRGVNFIGLCPFHPDKSPSFYVSPAKNICKCFSCGEGGDPVHFIMKHEQLGFYDALRFLAKKYHIEIEERELTDEEKLMQGERESMFILNGWAQKHFTARLFEHEEGRTIGLSYFNERGFREDIIRKFQLGYGLEKRDDLFQSAIKKGYRKTFLEKTGLVSFQENGTAFDRFRERVIFPVHTMSGKVVAFGGRVLKNNGKMAKYVNSPESDIYHKSNELYGIYFARNAIRKEDRCFLVEGYTDVIAMHQAGVENVVASCGTALTQGQIRMIHRLTDNITVLYDGDAAGIRAAIKGIDLFLEEGMNVKVLLLPDGEDPDSFARKNNAFEFVSYIHRHETDFIRFKTQLLLEEASGDPVKRAALVSDIIRSVAVIPDAAIRGEYVRECSQLLDVREQMLIDKLNGERRNRPQPLWKKAPAPSQNPPSQPLNVPVAANNAPVATENVPPAMRRNALSPFRAHEETLLRYAVRSGEQVLFDYTDNGGHIVVKVAEYICSELQHDGIAFTDPLYERMLEEAVTHCNDPEFNTARYFLSHPDAEISHTAIDLMDDKYPFHFEPVRKMREELLVQKDAVEALQGKSDLTYEEKRLLSEQKEMEGKLLKQMDVFEHALRRDLFALKEAHVRQKIAEIRIHIGQLEKDGKIDEAIERMKLLSALNTIKIELSKELGERIVLKM